MNLAYDEILAADDETRAGLFTTTAQRLGTTPQNAEKDFWVCWVLDALFNGRPGGPRLLFKGGTSLSKAFGLINRFSEDIDVTVFRDDLGEAYSVEDLAARSGKKREAALDAIKTACAAYITGPLLSELRAIAAQAGERNGLPAGALKILPHPRTTRPCWFTIRRTLRRTAMSNNRSRSSPGRSRRSTPTPFALSDRTSRRMRPGSTSPSPTSPSSTPSEPSGTRSSSSMANGNGSSIAATSRAAGTGFLGIITTFIG
jgi:hypothetical protein